MPPKPFSELKQSGRARRMRLAAMQALTQYEIHVETLRSTNRWQNAVFSVTTEDGRAYALRVCGTHSMRNEKDLHSQVAWLNALDRDTELGTPVPQRSKSGGFVVQTATDELDECFHCMLMSWVPGSMLLGNRLTAKNIYKMGQLLARLHRHADGYKPPSDFTSRKMDGIFAGGEVDVLSDASEALPRHYAELLSKVREAVDETYKRLYSSEGLRVIHGDYWHGNIKVHRGRLHPYDFEDVVWGFPVQDIAVGLTELMGEVGQEQFVTLRTAMQHGYETEEPWPENFPGEVDLLQLGRVILNVNETATFNRTHLSKHMRNAAPLFEQVLKSGRLFPR